MIRSRPRHAASSNGIPMREFRLLWRRSGIFPKPTLSKSLLSQFVGRSPTLARNRQAKEPQSGWGRWSVEFEVQEVQEVQGATNELTR
jgi:hypothetical protein